MDECYILMSDEDLNVISQIFLDSLFKGLVQSKTMIQQPGQIHAKFR